MRAIALATLCLMATSCATDLNQAVLRKSRFEMVEEFGRPQWGRILDDSSREFWWAAPGMSERRIQHLEEMMRDVGSAMVEWDEAVERGLLPAWVLEAGDPRRAVMKNDVVVSAQGF